MYDFAEPMPLPLPEASAGEKLRAWHKWAAQETMVRTLLGLYIVDGMVSQFSGNPTFARHLSNPLFLPSNDVAFNATTVDTWMEHMHRSGDRKIRFRDIYHQLFEGSDDCAIKDNFSWFHHKVILEGIRCLVSDANRVNPPPVGVPRKQDILYVLRQLRADIIRSRNLSSKDRSAALLQWHTICLDMMANTARGTRRICHLHGISQSIFGGYERHEGRIRPQNWVNSRAARIALLHATHIHAVAARLPLGMASDVNVPGALFAATTTYSAFALAGVPTIILPVTVNWEETLTNQDDNTGTENSSNGNSTCRFIDGTINNANDASEQYVRRDLPYDLTAIRTLLRSLALQWGVAQEMEEVVSAWIKRCGLE